MPDQRSRSSAIQRTSIVFALVAWLSAAMCARADPQDFAQIERGRYLAAAADCAGCHTRPGSSQAYTGGRPIETPFGTMVAPNITPDAQTGIGAWTDEQFDAAVRRGRRRDGSRLYPAMPFTYYTRMSRDDVAAIRAYLATVPAVHNAVVSNTLPFPFNVRAVMRAWDALYFHAGELRSDASKTPEWNRGVYLVQGPGHCGACHTPKSILGGDRSDAFLHGFRLQDWFAPDITNDAQVGLGNWSVEDIAGYLKTGHNRVTAATGPMAEEVALGSSHMTDADLRAVAAYLKTVPGDGEGTTRAVATDDPMMTAGAAIYRDQCSACHGLEGRGVDRLFPSLADSSMVRSSDPATLIRIVLRGARSVATDAEPTSPGMPSYGRQLDDNQVASVLTYVRNAWGTHANAVAADMVQHTRSALATRSD